MKDDQPCMIHSTMSPNSQSSSLTSSPLASAPLQGAPEKIMECGCTCTAIILQGRVLILANVGDSLAVLGSRSRVEEGHFQAEVVTVRHHGLNKEEAERIQAKHSHVVQLLDDGYLSVLNGPYQVSGHHVHAQAFGGWEGQVTTCGAPHMLPGDGLACALVQARGVWGKKKKFSGSGSGCGVEVFL